jgi:hypothetical protein
MVEDSFAFSDRGWIFPPLVATILLVIQSALFVVTEGSPLVLLLGPLSYVVFSHIVPLEFRKSIKYDVWPMVSYVQFWLAYSTFMGETLTWNSYLTRFLSIAVCGAVSVSYVGEWMSHRKKPSFLIMMLIFMINIFFPSKEIFIENMFYRFIIIRVCLYCSTHFIVTAWQRSGPIMSNEVSSSPVFYDCLRNFQTLWILFGWNVTSMLGIVTFIVMSKRVNDVVRRSDHRI